MYDSEPDAVRATDHDGQIGGGKFCPSCGNALDSTRPFCPSCGKSISARRRSNFRSVLKALGIGSLLLGAIVVTVGEVWLEDWNQEFKRDATTTAVADAEACLDYWSWGRENNARVVPLLVLMQKTPTAAEETAHDQQVISTLRSVTAEMERATVPALAREFSGLTLEQFKIQLQMFEVFAMPDWSTDRVIELSDEAAELNLPIEDARRDLIVRCGS